MSSRLALLVSAALLCGGCKVTSDIGKSCLLVKRGTGSDSAPVTLEDLQDGQDFISFGALDCEDLVCVLDANTPRVVAKNGQVQGYCSKACVAETPNTCAVTDAATDPNTPEAVKTRMACRPLLLDQKALEDLKATDPATYASTFGNNTSPYFCAVEPTAK
jgi:hypothetical protein